MRAVRSNLNWIGDVLVVLFKAIQDVRPHLQSSVEVYTRVSEHYMDTALEGFVYNADSIRREEQDARIVLECSQKD